MLKRKSNVTVKEVPKQRQTTKQEQVVKQTVKVVIGEEKKKKKKRRRKRIRDTQQYQRVRRSNPYNNFYGDPTDGYNIPPRPRAYMTNVGNIPTRVQVNTETGIRQQDANNLGIRRQLEIIRENDRLRAEQLRTSKELRDSQVDTFSARSFDSAPSSTQPVDDLSRRSSQDRPNQDEDSQTTKGVFMPIQGVGTGVGGAIAQQQLKKKVSGDTSSTSSASSMATSSPASPPPIPAGFRQYKSGKRKGMYYRGKGGNAYTEDEARNFRPEDVKKISVPALRRGSQATNPSAVQPRRGKKNPAVGTGVRDDADNRELDDILEGYEVDEEVDVDWGAPDEDEQLKKSISLMIKKKYELPKRDDEGEGEG
jgi:hypothetical protein